MTKDLNEKTFLLLKPDALQRGLTGRIITRFEEKGLKIVAAKLVQVSKDQAEQHYLCHKGKEFYPSLIDFITSSPCMALVLAGHNAIEIVRKLMGDTDPLDAGPGTIRGDMSLDVKHNLVHASDSPQNYKREVSIYFSPAEILSYNLELEKWIYYV